MKREAGLVGIFFCFLVYLRLSIQFEDRNEKVWKFSGLVPRKVHISKSDTQTTFSWSVLAFADSCTLNILEKNFTLNRYSQYIYQNYFYHFAVPNLVTDQAEFYSISCENRNERQSRTFRINSKESLNKILIFGDFSTSRLGDKSNNQHASVFKGNILKYLENDVEGVDSIWHLGDFAYDLFSNSGARGLEFMSDIENVASYKPYISVSGNHEIRKNFHVFKSFFTDKLFFTRTIGPCKIIAISTEFDFFYMKPGMFPIKHSFLTYLKQKQLNWLKKELKGIDRKKFPFVVVVGHKPLYCSKNYDSSMIMAVCTLQAEVMRNTFESILVKYKVDLGIFAHIHLYERTYPVKFSQSDPAPADPSVYLNPSSPIYVISGVAGNLESENIIFTITSTPDPWTYTIKESLGYSLLTVANCTHLLFQHISFGESQWDDAFSDQYHTKRQEDYFWLIKS